MTKQESHEKIAKIVEEMRSLRLNILPAYCYDEDEYEKSINDYITYYANGFKDKIMVLDNYVEALQSFAKQPEVQSNINRLIDAREKFIKNFPFCYDELVDIDLEDKEQYFEFEPKFSYEQEIGIKFLIDRLRDYKELLKSLENYLSDK